MIAWLNSSYRCSCRGFAPFLNRSSGRIPCGPCSINICRKYLFRPSVFPDGLKIAKVVPVYKSGDKNDIKNYRPISLLPVISKIFEKLMLCRISVFFSKHNVLNLHQHGFRPSFSTSVGYWLCSSFTLTRFVMYNQHRLVISSLYSTTYISATLQWFVSSYYEGIYTIKSTAKHSCDKVTYDSTFYR